LGPDPGIDARHLYNRREDLAKLLSGESRASGIVSDSETKIDTDQPAPEDVKALRLLLEEIERQFFSVSEKLKQLKNQKEEQATWDLLWTTCAKGNLLETTEVESGETFAFQVESWYYKDKSYKKEP
jgi:hypothetical protein